MSVDQTAPKRAGPGRELIRASPGLGSLLATDALATLAELASVVVLTWWMPDARRGVGHRHLRDRAGGNDACRGSRCLPLGRSHDKTVQIRLGLAGIAWVNLGLAWCSTHPFALLPVMAFVLAKVRMATLGTTRASSSDDTDAARTQRQTNA
jgi:hypothetical protein